MSSVLKIAAIATLPVLAGANLAAAAVLAPLSTFGGGDGWLAPGEGGYAFLGTANNERGIAFGNNRLYLASRSGGNNIRILNPTTGADLGSLSNTGITGGTFAINTMGVGGDGAIYVNNLTTAIGTGANNIFKVYKWATESSAPVQVINDTSSLAGARLGDSLAIIGSGANTRLAAGFGSAPTVAGNNSYAIIDPTAGTVTPITIGTNPPAAGDFRLGITFTDSTHVIGIQTGGVYRYTSFSGSTGTLVSSTAIPDPAGATADRLLAYAVINGTPVLAVQSIGDSHVSVYDITNPAAPVHLGSANNTSGSLTTNANGTGQLAWNYTGGTTATLYAMSTNQGIQAFTVTIPEPATLGVVGAMGLLTMRRRK